MSGVGSVSEQLQEFDQVRLVYWRCSVDTTRNAGRLRSYPAVGRSVTVLPDAPGKAAFAPPAASPFNSASRLG